MYSFEFERVERNLNGGSARLPVRERVERSFPVQPVHRFFCPRSFSSGQPPFLKSPVQGQSVQGSERLAPPGRSVQVTADGPFAPFPFVPFIRAEILVSVQVVQVRVSPVVRESLFP